jgi:hypothetical protein
MTEFTPLLLHCPNIGSHKIFLAYAWHPFYLPHNSTHSPDAPASPSRKTRGHRLGERLETGAAVNLPFRAPYPKASGNRPVNSGILPAPGKPTREIYRLQSPPLATPLETPSDRIQMIDNPARETR